MLIRSQNKKILIDMTNLIIGLDKSDTDTKAICFHTAAMDGEASAILGEYSTTEKAVIVINMIQDAYINAEITKFTVPEICKLFREAEDTKENKVLAEKIGKRMEENMVFQMPQDEEIE